MMVACLVIVGCPRPQTAPERPGPVAGQPKTPAVPAQAAPAAAGRAGEPVALTEATFESTILQSKKPAMVDFWATWCGPCRQQAPIVEKVAGAMGDKITVAKLNVDEVEAVAKKYNVDAIPTLIFFKDGQEVARKVGLTQEAELVDLIKSKLGVQ
jgi:thioredoxin 1